MNDLSPMAKAMLDRYRRDMALEPALQARMLQEVTERLARSELPLQDIHTTLEPLPIAKGWPAWVSSLVKLSALGLTLAGIATAFLVRQPGAPLSPGAPVPRAAAIVASPLAEEPRTAKPELSTNDSPSMDPRARGHDAEGTSTAPGVARARELHRQRTPRLDLARRAAGGATDTKLPTASTAHAVSPSPSTSPRADEQAARARADEQPDLPEGVALDANAQMRSASALSEELALLQSAHRALETDHYERARAALSEHGRRFPDGELADLRAVTNVMLQCRAEKTLQAQEAARAFLRANPRSPYAQRVRAICE